jgi:hypothetical protein
MPTAAESMVEIPALQRDGRTIIQAFRSSLDVGNWGKKAIDVYETAPTLAQLRYADSASDAIRENIRSHVYKGEFTADFIDYSAKKPEGVVVPTGFLYVNLVQRPGRVFFDEESKVWRYEGGKVIGIEFPPEGWQIPDKDGTLWNPETGYHILTEPDREKAIRKLSRIMTREQAEKEVSYSWRWDENHQRLSPVSRCYHWTAEHGPWNVDAGWYSPESSDPDVGSRVVRTGKRLVIEASMDYAEKYIAGLRGLGIPFTEE